MAENGQEKSRGSTFAEQQLLRHGWEQGKGLGRQEDGISEAIKVKVKSGKGGVGHNEGEQFTFHWWDHVFNKASASLQVESDQNGVSVKKIVEEEENGMISNKKPRKASLAKAKLYGCFVKSATLLSGQEQPEPKASHSDDSSSSDDEDQKLDLSSTTKLSDADLMKVCGGRTAHKGARHGFTMSAKLARLEQQEAEFMAKYGKKSQSASCSPKCTTPTTQSAAQSPERQEKEILNLETKKSSSEEMYGDTVTDSHEVDSNKSRKKKKKKSRSDNCNGEITLVIPTEEEELKLEENVTAVQPQKMKRKHKKSKKNNDNGEMDDITIPTVEDESVVEETKKSSSEEMCVNGDTVTDSHEVDSNKSRKKKKKKTNCSDDCNEEITPIIPTEEEELNPEENGTAVKPQKIKRKHKKSKTINHNGETDDITIPTAEGESVVEEVLSEQTSHTNNTTKRKKSKSSKRCERPVVPEEEQPISDTDSSRAQIAQHPVLKKKRVAVNMEEVLSECKEDQQTLENSVSEVSMPPKKRKKKKCKDERIKPDSDH